MNATEKAVLITAIGNLENSAQTSWTRGELEQWVEWARRMRDTIMNNTSIIKSMLAVPDDESQKPDKKEDTTIKT